MEAERYTVGIALLNPETIADIAGLGLEVSHFQEPRCGAIWEKLKAAWREDRPAGLAAISASLPPELKILCVDLATTAPIAQDVTYWAKEVMAAAWARHTAVEVANAARALIARQPFEPIEMLRGRIANILSATQKAGTDPLASLLPRTLADKFIAEVESAVAGEIAAIPTGLVELNKAMSGGWFSPDFTLLAARPSVGKTTLAINLAVAAIDAKKAVAFFTIEMRDTQILAKVISRMSGVFGNKYRTGDLSQIDIDRTVHAVEQYAQSKLHINNRASQRIEWLEEECRRLKRLGLLDIVFIDYVQLMRAEGRWSSRQAELSEISTRLKNLGLNLDVPIVCLAQINRQAGKDIPELTHLKDSGSLEQDADNVIIIHRDEWNDHSLVFRKNRHGPLVTVSVAVDMGINRFTDGGAR